MPLDFSRKSRQALEVAVPLAEHYGGRIFLIHVLEPIQLYPSYSEPLASVAIPVGPATAPYQQKLSDLARELVPAGRLGETQIRVGSARAEIIAAANELEADLIVISTDGHTGLKHVFLGSTAEHVVRHASCPVLTVRRH